MPASRPATSSCASRLGPTGPELVLATIAEHASSLLATARRYSLCADDAQDAYQRGLEIFLRHAGHLDPAGAAPWLRTGDQARGAGRAGDPAADRRPG